MAKKHPLQVPKKPTAPKAAKRRGMAPTHLAQPIDQTSGDRRFVVRCRDWENVWAANLPIAEAMRVKELVAGRGMSRTVRYEDMPTEPELLALCEAPKAQPHGFPAVAAPDDSHLSSREEIPSRIAISLEEQTKRLLATLTPRELEVLRTRFRNEDGTPAPAPPADPAAVHAIETAALETFRAPAMVAAAGAAAAANARHDAMMARKKAAADAQAAVAAAAAALKQDAEEATEGAGDGDPDPLADELAGSAVADILGASDEDDDLDAFDDIVAPGA